MILIEPEKGIGDEKIPHLITAIIEDQRVPVLMQPLSRVLVFK
jgi:hypothetical protein